MAKRARTKASAAANPPAGTPQETKQPSGPASSADRRLVWLDRMRPFRERHERDVGLERVIQSLEREMRDQQAAVGDIIDAWNQVAPPAVRDLAAIAGVSQGTLTLVVTSSGASYELSRALRDGLERTLMQRLPARVKRIRVRIAAS